MPLPGYVDNKTRAELVELLCSGLEPGSVMHLQASSALQSKIVDEASELLGGLEDAITTAAAASDRLGRKVFWLNVILVVATAVGAFAAVWSAFS